MPRTSVITAEAALKPRRRTDIYLPPESGKIDPRLIRTNEQIRGLAKRGLIRSRKPDGGKR